MKFLYALNIIQLSQLEQLELGLSVTPEDDPGYAELLQLKSAVQELVQLTEGLSRLLQSFRWTTPLVFLGTEYTNLQSLCSAIAAREEVTASAPD